MSISTGWNAAPEASERRRGEHGMNGFRRGLIVFAVACAVPGSTFVLGQVTVSQTTITIVPQAEGRKAAAPKAGIKRKQVEPERPVTKKAVVMMKAFAIQPARPAGAVAAQPAAALDAQAAQYFESFRPMFRAEYYFIKNGCNLSRDQRKELAGTGERVTRAAARAFVEAQQKMMRGGWRPASESPDAHKFIEDEVSRSIATLLTSEQKSLYRLELGERAASRRQVFIDNFVAKLDADLVLTADQRDKLARALAANWNDSWGQSLQLLQNLENFFPNIPDQVVAPLLTENQKAVWRRIPRNQNVFWGFSIGGMMMGNDPLDDPELQEAEKAAQAAEKKKP
jgi:hypothetical protein